MSDGSPLTAEDFRYSFMRMIDPEQAHYYAASGYLFKNGEAYLTGTAAAEDVGIEVIDSHTLKITCEDPGLGMLTTLPITRCSRFIRPPSKATASPMARRPPRF